MHVRIVTNMKYFGLAMQVLSKKYIIRMHISYIPSLISSCMLFYRIISFLFRTKIKTRLPYTQPLNQVN